MLENCYDRIMKGGLKKLEHEMNAYWTTEESIDEVERMMKIVTIIHRCLHDS